MALCPFAKHELIPPGSNDPRIKPRAAILHVADGMSPDLHDYFNGPSGGIEAHFYILLDGTILQYRDTDWQADANLDANDFAVAIETQGLANGTWTKAQLKSIKRLLLWLNKVHDIPLRKIQRWNGSGVGYHTQFGAPSHWTPVAKSCPGPNRIKQFNTTLVRWFRSDPTAPPPPPPPPVVKELVVVARNVYTASSDASVLATLSADLKAYHPHLFVLTEAASHADVLKLFAKRHGLTLLQQEVPPHPERGDDTGDVALLVAKGVTIKQSWLAKMTEVWKVFSHHVLHQPHVYEVARLVVDGQEWRVRGSHFPTHGLTGGNHVAFLESVEKSKVWLDRSTLPSIDVGDLNEQKAALAAWYGDGYQVFGKDIDVAVTKNVTSCVWKELPKGGSDHFGRLFTFTLEK